MNFYKRAGVGRYSAEEQMMLDAINRLIEQKRLPAESIPDCHSLDELIELKQYLESLDETIFTEDQAEPTTAEIQHEPEPEPQFDDEPEAEFSDDSDEPELFSGIPAEEDTTAPGPAAAESPDVFVSDNYNPFADPIIERSYNQAESATVNPGIEDEEQLDLEESKGNPLADLPPHTKRRAAEQTADTLLKGYAQIVPIPFKWWAKFPEEKIEKMAFNGEIDLSLEVSDGVSFDDYMKQTNAQLDEIFKVDADTLSDIREPLIEVLMEQNMELTPTQRLLAAVFSHVMQMFTVAFKLSKQNNRILSYQKHLTFLMQGSKVAA